jgi:hypothetical protein
VIYTPLFATIFVGRQMANAILEKRLLRRAEALLTSSDGRIGIRPLVATSIGTGTRLFYKNLWRSTDASLTSTLGASGSSRQRHLLHLAMPGHLQVTGGFTREPKQIFYGIGVQEDGDVKTSFQQQDACVRLSFPQRLSDVLRLQASVAFRSFEIAAGRSSSAPSTTVVYAAEQLPGLSERTSYLEAEEVLRASLVDVPGSPTRGNRTLLGLGYNRSLGGVNLTHMHVRLFTEQFRELFYRRTLSLLLGSAWSWAPGDDRVPFYGLSSLGGTETMRGYRGGRFRDRGVVFATANYKFPIWKLIDGGLFYELGRSLHDVNDFTFDDWRNTYGWRIAAWVPAGLVFEHVIAYSDDGTHLLFNFKMMF